MTARSATSNQEAGGSRAAAEQLADDLRLGVKAGAELPHSKVALPAI
jgi:hypothetical protein